VVYDHSVKLGIVRAFTNQAAQCLQDVVNMALAETDDRLPREEELGVEFGRALMNELEAFLVEEG